MSKRKIQLGALAIAAAVGLAVLLALIVRSGGDASNPARTEAPEPTAEVVAAGFLAAYGALDVEDANPYLADDADVTEIVGSLGDAGASGTVGEFERYLSLLEGLGYKQTLHTCDELRSGSGSGTTVRCGFDFHLLGSDRIGRGPFKGSFFRITVRDGEIVRAAKTWGTEKFSPRMWEPFANWVSATYPEDARVMYTDATLSGARLTDRSVRLWEKHSREYADLRVPRNVKVAETFMEARNAYDAPTALSLLAGPRVVARLLYDNDTFQEMPAVRLNRHELALAFEAERLFKVQHRSVVCRPAGQEDVACTSRLDSRLRQIEGDSPTESRVRLGFRRHQIDRLGFPWLSVSFPAGLPHDGARFVLWVKRAHADAYDRLFEWVAQERVLRLTREAVDLLARYLDEYERFRSG